MAHIQRRDFAINFLCELLTLPISFHPAAGLIKVQLASSRELACDELAIEQCIDRHEYVHSLLTLADRVCRVPSPDYGLGIFDANVLEERIMNLLRKNCLPARSTRSSLVLVLVALFGTCICASAFAVRIAQEETTNTGNTPAGQDDKVARVGPGITAPQPIFTPDPRYPKSARNTKREGTVQLWCVIGEDGSVRDIRVTRSVDPDLDKASLDTLRRWKFKPAMKEGKPVAVQVNVETTFRWYD